VRKYFLLNLMRFNGILIKYCSPVVAHPSFSSQSRLVGERGGEGGRECKEKERNGRKRDVGEREKWEKERSGRKREVGEREKWEKWGERER
jgi:hypothetical protein